MAEYILNATGQVFDYPDNITPDKTLFTKVDPEAVEENHSVPVSLPGGDDVLVPEDEIQGVLDSDEDEGTDIFEDEASADSSDESEGVELK